MSFLISRSHSFLFPLPSHSFLPLQYLLLSPLLNLPFLPLQASIIPSFFSYQSVPSFLSLDPSIFLSLSSPSSKPLFFPFQAFPLSHFKSFLPFHRSRRHIPSIPPIPRLSFLSPRSTHFSLSHPRHSRAFTPTPRYKDPHTTISKPHVPSFHLAL